MNPRILSRSIGILLLLLAAAMGVCLLLGAWLPVAPSHNAAIEFHGWIISLITTGIFGAGLFFVGRRREQQDLMIRKEAMAIVGIGWAACSLFAALPYLLCSPHAPFDRALFESVSGLTTTGATIFADIEALPKTILLWRSITEWLGGMGILGMFVLVLSGIGTSGKTVVGTESSSHSSDLSVANVRQTTRSLWFVYIVLTFIAGLGMAALGMTAFQAINHALTSTATGGFGTENDSISSFGPALKLWIIAIMVLSSISFPLYVAVFKKRDFSVVKQHEESFWFLIIISTMSLILILDGTIQRVGEPAVNILFNTVSIMTGTGYVVGDYDGWSLFGQEAILLLMVFGGCSGSTTGGLKISRIILWVKVMRIELTRAFRPKMVISLKLNGSPVPDAARGQLVVVLTMAGFFFATGSLLLHLFEPDTSLLGCISAVLSCLCNVGPAFAEFGPTSHYASLHTPGTLMLPILMILGRLEYVAVLVLFSRKMWRRY